MMKKVFFNNGVKYIYEYRSGNITSFCIGFNSGALVEGENQIGMAHAVEHMLFKGTINRSEYEINKLCDEIFGFNNAMTNYPYVIYYGTSLSQDFEIAFELYSDVVLHPIFPEDGFKEEIDIIKEELKEWKDDFSQLCEDELFYNAFSKRRIKELIIGNEKSISDFTLDKLQGFYNKNYVPENCVITVVSSLPFEAVEKVVSSQFNNWNPAFKKVIQNIDYEANKTGLFLNKNSGAKGAKIQFIFSIDKLSTRELKVLSIFNAAFGEGTSSLLFDEVRTKKGLAYEVFSSIKNEYGIKLFSIFVGTSYENIQRTIDTINFAIDKAKTSLGLDKAQIEKLSKSLRLRKELKLEKSIELCKALTTYEIMYDSCELLFEENNDLENINEEEIMAVVKKVLRNPTIQIISG
jgi:predicted Zn-dependent peptidase